MRVARWPVMGRAMRRRRDRHRGEGGEDAHDAQRQPGGARHHDTSWGTSPNAPGPAPGMIRPASV